VPIGKMKDSVNYPVTVQTAHGPFTVTNQWMLLQNGDRWRQYIFEGKIFKHLKHYEGSELPDIILEQHFQLHPTLWFHASVCSGEGRTDEYLEEIGALTILDWWPQWVKEWEQARALEDLRSNPENN
jgi:hypothetical protein